MHNDSEESANNNSPRLPPSPPITRSRYDSMRRWQQDCPVSDHTTHLLSYTEQAFRVGFTCAIPAISARPLSVVASGESIGSSLAPALPCPPSHGGSISPSSSRSCAEHRSSKARHTGVQALPQNRPPSPPSQHASRPQHEPITALFPSCIAPGARFWASWSKAKSHIPRSKHEIRFHTTSDCRRICCVADFFPRALFLQSSSSLFREGKDRFHHDEKDCIQRWPMAYPCQ